MRRRRGPVRATGDGFVVDLDDDEAELIGRLLTELGAMLADPDPDSSTQTLLVRLFPVVHPDDEAAEHEYQRLMRNELVESKLSAIQSVQASLDARHRKATVDEPGLVAFMQAINSIRLVLGTMLGVSDDPDQPEVLPGMGDTPEFHLYAYLSWLLEHCVAALSRGID